MVRPRREVRLVKLQLEAVQVQIARLRLKEDVLLELIESLSRDAPTRKRTAGVKPAILEIVRQHGGRGVSATEVDAELRRLQIEVASGTVGSVLSRLKASGLLVYESRRYYNNQ